MKLHRISELTRIRNSAGSPQGFSPNARLVWRINSPPRIGKSLQSPALPKQVVGKANGPGFSVNDDRGVEKIILERVFSFFLALQARFCFRQTYQRSDPCESSCIVLYRELSPRPRLCHSFLKIQFGREGLRWKQLPNVILNNQPQPLSCISW